ncbi:MAG: glycine cleavage system protein GcvH [Gammaproteobacteria bacterium]|nr:glycine cleavage system protein GcvH [Gammaproteobacteria bacterium]
MSDIPNDRQYTETHEWLRELDDGTIELGITDHAQESLGDLVFVELPEVDSEVATGEECVVVESTKAASDVFSPLDGEITAVNEALEDQPELVNQSPWDEGWLVRIRPAGGMPEGLMDADAYAAHVESEG